MGSLLTGEDQIQNIRDLETDSRWGKAKGIKSGEKIFNYMFLTESVSENQALSWLEETCHCDTNFYCQIQSGFV